MAAMFADGPWPLGFDMGADLQFIHDDYCQPPAREPPKSTEKKKTEAKDTNEDEDKSETGEDEDQENENDQDKDEKYEDAGAQEDEITYKKKALLRVSNGSPTEYYESPDLKVVLKNKHGSYSFLVSSHALSIASKVWKRILNPQGFKELETETLGFYGTVKIMHLADDDVLALDLIFQILHLKTDEVLSYISFGFLRRIAIVSDKYECGKALNPWPKLWMKAYEVFATTPRYEDWIFIAKALQSKNTKIKAISRELVLDVSSKSQCGKYFRRDMATIADSKVEVDLELLPDGFLAYVIKERSKAVHTIITTLRQFVSDIASVNQYLGSSGLIRSKFCENEPCSDIAVGSLIRSLKMSKLWPLLSSGTPHDWHGSVRTLVKRIEGLKMTTLIRKNVQLSAKTSTGLPTGAFGSIVVSTHGQPSTGGAFGALPTATTNATPSGPSFGSALSPNPFGSTSTATVSTFGQRTAFRSGSFGSGCFGGASSTSSNTQPPASLFGAPLTTNISRPTSTTALSPFGATTTNGQAEAAASRTAQSQTNTNSSSKDNQTGETRIQVQAGAGSGFGPPKILGPDGFADVINDLRYGYPAFDGVSYVGEYRPCASAFALGDLIAKCRKVVKDISDGGYEET